MVIWHYANYSLIWMVLHHKSPWCNITCTDWHIKIIQNPENCNTKPYRTIISTQPPPVKTRTSTQKVTIPAWHGSLPPQTCLNVPELSNLLYLQKMWIVTIQSIKTCTEVLDSEILFKTDNFNSILVPANVAMQIFPLQSFHRYLSIWGSKSKSTQACWNPPFPSKAEQGPQSRWGTSNSWIYVGLKILGML